MFIDTLGATPPAAPTNTGPEDVMGKDTFLTLLVAQLRNQDPLNPMEGTEFTAQLAQFSSLEQLQNVNDNLDLIHSNQGEELIFKAMDFMGKEIDVNGDQLILADGNSAKGGFLLETSGDCVVTVYNASGAAVKQIPMGSLDPGSHQFAWDGTENSGSALDEGIYNFTVTAVDGTGQSHALETFLSGQVDRVNIEGQIPLLYVGDLPVALPSVRDVRMPDEP
jgi:flagellar basal-body rod modification protein FlgD